RAPCPATPLSEVDPGEQDRRHCKPDRGASRQRMIRSQGHERQKAERREQKLCGSLDEDVDDDARGGERAWDGVTRQQSRADHVAADLRHRQQDVDRLPNEPQKQACAKLRAHLWAKEQPPARPRHATETVTARTITTSRIPQPTLAIAWPTASRPDQMVRTTSAAIPPSQATTPACLTIPPSDPPLSPQPAVCLRTEAWEGQCD